MSELARDEHWQRLDPRMMLVHPVRELLRFLPVLVGVFIAGSAAGDRTQPWQLLAIGVPVGLGMLRYLTTSFRVASGRVELRTRGAEQASSCPRRSTGSGPST